MQLLSAVAVSDPPHVAPWLLLLPQEYFERAAAVYIDVDEAQGGGGGVLGAGPSKAAYEEAGAWIALF